MTATESVVSEAPFIVRRTVKWGDCDPAGVVYTVTFGEYVISAANLFYNHLLGARSADFKRAHGFRTPTRALEFDFRRALWPDEVFEMTVSVHEIRSRTYVLEVMGRMATVGEDVFRAMLTPVCIARDERRAVDIPVPFRTALERHRDTCRAVPAAT
ncbi:acyl-CoA thioesterase [Sphingomonas sp.]|uniref:acyl-CoA thioesterase n=1 Tax=Sphingomonas sp. TaxID=28214 RepID=UPI0025D7ADD1|nr:acyl-CoA thioesterase [Sphingomonas sp.]MBV9529227.1 thioesterase family protein [Sphingomonas sp.]